MTDTPPDDPYRELREAAEQATPGPWETDPECGNQNVLAKDGAMVADCAIFLNPAFGDRSDETNEANARYIVAAQPTTILALLAERDRLVARLAEAETAA